MRKQFAKLALTATKDRHIGLSLLTFALALALLGCAGSRPIPQIQHGEAITDSRDGKTYKTVIIGSQTWMAENLNYDAENSRCYNNEPEHCETFGRLYDWKTAKAACPSGWHLPSDKEWDALINYVRAKENAQCADNKCDAMRLKARDGWNRGTAISEGRDTYGFAALPGGSGTLSRSNSSKDTFKERGNQGHWWSAGEYSDDEAYNWVMFEILPFGDWWHSAKETLYSKSLNSVRCVKN